MKTLLALLGFWFIIQSESGGQLLPVGPFIFKQACLTAQDAVVDAKVILPCFFKADPIDKQQSP